MKIDERIQKLQKLMEERNIDFYFIPTSDCHDSEYVDSHFACREFMSGFTGSAGIMVITREEAYLWADGRYFIQAQNQIKGTMIQFMKWGNQGVLNPTQFIESKMFKNACIGFDGKVVDADTGLYFKRLADEFGGSLHVDEDLVDLIWEDRPPLPCNETFILDEKFTGRSLKDKLKAVREKMVAYNCNCHVINSLDDTAYLLNMRGHDIKCTPVFLSYLMINDNNAILYINEKELTEETKTYLANNDVEVKAYNEIYEDAKKLSNRRVLVDRNRLNYNLLVNLLINNDVFSAKNPSELMKAMKNEVEIENIKKAHIKDGVALTKFLCWLDQNIGKLSLNEYEVSEKLASYREAQDDYLEPSFDTISAYGPNAAMMHYKATLENNAELKPEGMYLVDSGGQYLDGTTDVTRTVSLGKVSDEMIHDFTLALKGMINLSRCKFLKGCTGINLDILARNALWNEEVDYKCGTGHGVGYLLGVHEGPQGIRWAKSAMRSENTVLEPGMVVSDEPGVYIENKYGIRIENLLVIREGNTNEYGTFMEFETLTYAPIDTRLVDAHLLGEQECKWLNNYHENVYNKLSPYLDEEEKVWLKERTQAI